MSFEKCAEIKKPLKFGPFGSENGGERFDDGVHSDVRQLVICYTASSIRYIQIEYDDNGSSIWSEKHGHVKPLDGDQVNTVKLDYPDEVLTSIHGYHTDKWYWPTYITSLTLTSNSKVYGPFGANQEGKYFSIQVPGCKIVGFHGRSDFWNDLRAIGAYLKPLDHPSKPFRAPTGQYGYPAAYNYAPHPPALAPYGGGGYGNHYGPPSSYNTNGYYDYPISHDQLVTVGCPPKQPKIREGDRRIIYKIKGNKFDRNTGDALLNLGHKESGGNMDSDDDDDDDDED